MVLEWREHEHGLILVLRLNLYLIISRKVIHEGKNLTTHTLIKYLLNKWCGEIVLRTSTIQITEISTYVIAPYFLSTGMGFETHFVKGMG